MAGTCRGQKSFQALPPASSLSLFCVRVLHVLSDARGGRHCLGTLAQCGCCQATGTASQWRTYVNIYTDTQTHEKTWPLCVIIFIVCLSYVINLMHHVLHVCPRKLKLIVCIRVFACPVGCVCVHVQWHLRSSCSQARHGATASATMRHL